MQAKKGSVRVRVLTVDIHKDEDYNKKPHKRSVKTGQRTHASGGSDINIEEYIYMYVHNISEAVVVVDININKNWNLMPITALKSSSKERRMYFSKSKLPCKPSDK